MIQVIVEDIVFGKATIFPEVHNVDVVDIGHENMLVISYKDADGDKVVTYPMRHVYRYIVCPPKKQDDTETSNATEKTES